MFGFAPKINGFILTRDSYILVWGQIAGVAGLVTTGAIDPKAIGLSDKQAHVVMGICGAITAISARLANSSLPSKADAQKVSLPIKEQV